MSLVRLGETERAEQALAGLSEQDREHGDIRIATAALRLAHDDPHAATAALAPVLDRTDPGLLGDLGGSGIRAGGDRPGRARRLRPPPTAHWSAHWTSPSPTAC